MTGRPRGAIATAATLALLLVGACGRATDAPPDGRTPVWLDVSLALGDPPRDPADALAVVQAFGSERLQVRGVSTTFGNAPLVRAFPAAQALLERLESGRLRPWRGASSPDERHAPTEASELLAEALQEGPLTIIAAGPLTTVAAVLLRHPQLAPRVERLVLIGGQPGEVAPSADPQVAADPGSVRLLLDSDVAITLVPAGDASGLVLDDADLTRLESGNAVLRLITPGARGWLATGAAAGRKHLPVPALLAVDVVAHPGAVRCEAVVATLQAGGPGARLTVSSGPVPHGRRVAWCRTADPAAHDRILTDLLAARSTP